MADYSSWKVVDLKAELKRRGIPQTGLRVKQNFIDKLLELDSAGQAEPAAEQAPAEKSPEEQAEAVPPTEQDQAANTQEEQQESEKTATAPPPIEAATAPEQVEAAPRAPEQEAPVTEAPTAEPSEQAPPAPQEPAENREDASKPTDETTEAPSVPPAEKTDVDETPTSVTRESSLEDSRKRKRRSQSPPPSPRTAALKRAKAEDGQPRIILDETGAEEKDKPGEPPVPQHSKDVPLPLPAEQEEPASKQPGETEVRGDAMEVEPAVVQEHKEEVEPTEPKEAIPEATQDEIEAEKAHPPKHPSGDARFKGLFPAANGGLARSPSPPRGVARAEEEDRVVAPAVHPATTSVYIRNLMRPLQPAVLRKHLVSLATPPSASPDPDIVLDFFLDSIKTHCFATFANVSAAARVRSALHDTIWPDERTRKPLCVDFVPEEKVKEWIKIEQDSGNGGRGGPRWEVTYDETEDGVTAVLREASSTSQAPPRNSRDPTLNIGREPPLGPRAMHGDRGMRRGSLTGPPPPSRFGESFRPLDERFSSTTAKPKLYYLQVPRDVADKRLDRFDDLARAGPTRKVGGDEMRKYTFEDTDVFVDRGAEYGNRGGRRRFGRGGGGGGRFADRADWRDSSWRGRPR